MSQIGAVAEGVELGTGEKKSAGEEVDGEGVEEEEHQERPDHAPFRSSGHRHSDLGRRREWKRGSSSRQIAGGLG